MACKDSIENSSFDYKVSGQQIMVCSAIKENEHYWAKSDGKVKRFQFCRLKQDGLLRTESGEQKIWFKLKIKSKDEL